MLTLDFINVGYGDAILIRDMDAAFSMLVDCGDITLGGDGSKSSRISATEFLKMVGIKTLDVLVLTHLHRDHSGGLTELLASINVREFWTNYLPPCKCWGTQVPVEESLSAGARCLVESFNILLSALKQMQSRGTAIRQIRASSATAALTPALQAEIYLEDDALFKRQEEIWQSVLEGFGNSADLDDLDGFINNTSIRLRLLCGDTTVELPGDVYAACWEKHQLHPCTIMKLPHHGHRDSISPRLLEMLRPQHAVISVSSTRTDDCPATAVIETILGSRCALHMTDAVQKCGISFPVQQSVHFEIQV